MTIQAIADSQASANECKVHLTAIDTQFKTTTELEDKAAIQVVLHYYAHNCSASINNLVDKLDVKGSKGSSKALRYLGFNFTGACKNGTKDSERHLAGVDTYMAELKAIQELGLVPWYDAKIGDTKATKSDEEKAIAKEEKESVKAKAWMVEKAKSDPVMAAMLKYGKAYGSLAAINPGQAADQLDSDINGLIKGLTGALSGIKEAA